MKRLVTVLFGGLLVCAAVAPAISFEIELKGFYENRIRYFGRMGNDDLFGKTDFQDAGANTFVGFAGPNIYGTGNVAPVIADMAGGMTAPPLHEPSVVITRGGFSRWGSDALYNDMRMSLEPVIRVNPAIRLRGTYNIGGMRNKYRQTGTNEFGDGVGVAPLERYYMAQSSMNATDGVFGLWEQYDFVAQTPWCIIVAGFRDFPMGTGATYGWAVRNETLLLIAPYGPFRFLWGFWLGRGGYLESWQTVPDGSSKPSFFEGWFLTYDQGCLHAGGGVIYRLDRHRPGSIPSGSGLSPRLPAFYGASTADFNFGAVDIPAQFTINRQALIWEAHLKYFDGRFFANVEYAWINGDHQFDVGLAPGTGAQIGGRPLYMEAYHWWSELGMVSGPAKVSLLYAQVSGLVLNNGWYAGPFTPAAAGFPVDPGPGANSVIGLPVKMYLPFPICYQNMEPYEYLMFNIYAGGNNGGWGPLDLVLNSDEHGEMSDAYAFAGRVDYAVAANLNIWASYIWAHRLERAGFLNGGIQDAGDGVGGPGPGAPGSPGLLLAAYGGTTPYCPDGFIGWEAGIGLDWKLLEGLNLKLRYAYWQPGDWFDYAYLAVIPLGPVAVPNPNESVTTAGILKGRSPINAFEGKMVVEF